MLSSSNPPKFTPPVRALRYRFSIKGIWVLFRTYPPADFYVVICG